MSSPTVISSIVLSLSVLAAMSASPASGRQCSPVKVLAADVGASDIFGHSVAVSGDTMVVGAPRHDVGVNGDQGLAYVYRLLGSAWTHEATLSAAEGGAGDEFGCSVAVSGDTVVVGARLDDVGTQADQGAAYVFVRSGTVWTQQTQITASDGAAGDNFGAAVAISGDTAVVGVPLDSSFLSADHGSAYVFVRSGTMWTEQAKLTASDGAQFDMFGSAVGVAGDTVVVGAVQDDVGANAQQGSAYVFTRAGSLWTQRAKLTAADGAADDFFGTSAAISGDTVLVGALRDDVVGNVNQGSAYVFVRSGNLWPQQSKLTASGGAAGDLFGSSVAISGESAVVGARFDDVGTQTGQGSACVFVRSGAVWTQQANFTAADGATGDGFGISVALAGDTLAAGAFRDDSGAIDQGAAYVFSRSGTAWTQRSKLTAADAADGAAGDEFGGSVAASGDTAVVGAPQDDVGGNANQGSATVYIRSGSAWVPQARLTVPDGAAGDQFGWSVAISGETLVVGARIDDIGSQADQGSVYVFVRTGTFWTQQAKLTASDGESFDFFGSAVAVSGDTAVVGAHYAQNASSVQVGKAYVFVRSGTTWAQQAVLTAPDGEHLDLFGYSVAVDGDTAIVGAQHETVGGDADQGSAHVFVRSGVDWTHQAQLISSDVPTYGLFGFSVAMVGDTCVVGAIGGPGAADVFVRSGSAWTQQAKLTASDGAMNANAGRSVAVSGETVVLSSSKHKVGSNNFQGAAIVFARSGTVWTQQARLTAPDGAADDWFGYAVGISGDTVVAGANRDDVGANADQGAAWVFNRVGGMWMKGADFNLSGSVTVQDLFDFLAKWFAAHPNADVNYSATVTVQDIFDFLSKWFAGCA